MVNYGSGKMNKGFTLVIPLYNKAHCVRQTLDSVLNNHGEYPFKCLIIDDDSTDGSSEIGEEYDTKYPDVFQYIKIKHHGNKTPVHARNLGIKLTDTEYIGFLDADDELCGGFIDRGCNFLDEHPEYSLYGNGYLQHIEHNDKLYYCFYNADNITTFDDFVINGAFYVHWCANIYKTELAKKNMFIDTFGEDSFFKLKYIFNNEPIYIDNSTCESIIWNGIYSNSSEWNFARTNKNYIEEIFDSLKQNIKDFNYDIEIQNNELFLIKKQKIKKL